LRRMPQFKDLPVVALTAGVFKSQQDAARAAGMSDFISKPFDVPSTIALLQRLRRPSSVSNVVAQSELKTAADVPLMDVAQGLHVWKDITAYRAYLRRFVEGFGNAVDTMNASLAASDVAGAAALAHKLAGVASNLALPHTHGLAGEAERVLSNGYDATPVLERLRDSLVRTVATIEHFVAPAVQADDSAVSSPRQDATPISPDSLKALLGALLAALNTDNPEPAAVPLALLEAQVNPFEVARLRRCVQDYDFRGAEALTRSLASGLGISLRD
jgi:CheY-like chemotaxis protein